ncbi:hypothetical protein Tco_0957971 [Tanacetum coccineum]
MQHPQPNNNYVQQPPFNTNYMQQPMKNPKVISDPTTAIDMALVLTTKAFKLNNTTPTNNNQRSSSNPCNRQIAQPVQNVGNQLGHNAVQNSNIQKTANHSRNRNVVAAQAEGNVKPRKRDVAYLHIQLQISQKEEAGIQLNSKIFDFMAGVGAYDKIKEVNVNCTLKDNLQQASTSGTQTDSAPVYESDGSYEVHHSRNFYDNDIFNMFTQEEQYTELLEPVNKPHTVQQNNSNVISVESNIL